jgi:hypothetical protein
LTETKIYNVIPYVIQEMWRKSMFSKLPSSQFDEEWLKNAEKTEEDGGCDIGAGFRSYEVPNTPIDGILITPPTPERS